MRNNASRNKQKAIADVGTVLTLENYITAGEEDVVTTENYSVESEAGRRIRRVWT